MAATATIQVGTEFVTYTAAPGKTEPVHEASKEEKA